MSWKKHFQPVQTGDNPNGSYSPFSNRGSGANPGPAKTNYSSYLPDVYVGSPNRIERYGQYNTMDLDSEVNAALDILAEFTTQKNTQNKTPFMLDFKTKATNSEITIIEQYLQQWCKIQKFETRMFRIMRNTFKYGDQFFVRDPETKKLFHIDPAKLTKIIVNESEGKEPEQYVIKDFNLNFVNLVATTPYQTNGNVTGGGSGYLQGGVRGMVGNTNTSAGGGRFQLNQENEIAVDAEHVVHLSLSEGLDLNYPFGNSLLETVFKVFKQKELLEDAIIIYRVQRAPERRVFYVDVGNMPSHLAMQFVERVKTEIHQRRIPSATGGGSNVIDSAYNPLSINEDYFFPQTCLSLDTEIKLLDDRSLTLAEIIDEYNKGKTNYTYTVNQKTHELEPGKIVWAGVTRKNAQVVKVTLDNGESVTCTPDHRFIMRDGSEVEAQHLIAGNSIMPLYLHDAKTSKHQGANKYLKYTCPSDGKKKWVHTMVCPKATPDKGTEIHHIDCNSRNNNPDNLIEIMLPTDKSLRKMAVHMGYDDWRDFKENYAPNHSVISIERLEDTIDTGDITVESPSNSHNFALTIGIFVHNSEGRGSKVETLPGGTNLGEIDDLRYFTNKLVRGLRIPSSYLPTGPDDGQAQYSDGRVGTAYIQELRFNTYCERLQNLVVEELNQEFKRYLLEKGINIDTAMFDVRFQPPQNFASYRQAEIDNARIPTFTQMSAIPYVSNRFAMQRFLGLSDEEIAENERLWREENDEALNPPGTDAAGEMRGAGVSSAGISADLGGIEDVAATGAEPEVGGDATPPDTATEPAAGAEAPATDQTV